MLGDHFEHWEYLPQITITSSTYTTILSHTTAVVPAGTYLICVNHIYQNTLSANNYVQFQFLVDGVFQEDSSQYLEPDPGPGVLDSRATNTHFFRVTFASDASHTILMQGKRDGGTNPAYTRDIRCTFYEEDTARADYAYLAASSSRDVTTWGNRMSLPITVPTGGSNYQIWSRLGFTNPSDAKDIALRLLIDSTPITELQDNQYNTSNSNTGRANCWGKNINCFWIDEGAHTVNLEYRRQGGTSIGLGVYIGRSALRILQV